MTLKNISIKRKLILINLITIGVALLLIAATAVVGQARVLRQSLLHDLELQAKIIASNSTASLAFDDWKTTAEILSALKASPDITYAAIYAPGGARIAQYRRSDAETRTFPVSAEKEAYFSSSSRMGVVHPIDLSGENIGTVFIEADLERLNSGMGQLILMVATVLLAVFGAVLLLLRKFQQKITDPLLSLTRLMRQVSEEKSYGVRARFSGKDEIGLLAQGFNNMLAQIQARDEALARHRAQLEQEVAQRTARLTEAQRIARLGNWEWDIANNVLVWSDEVYRIFGLAPQQHDASYEAFLRIVHPGDRQFVNDGMRQAIKQERSYSLDHRILLPDGAVRHVHEQAEVIRDEGGRAIGMMGTVQDITERKDTEEKLRDSQEILEKMFETTHFHVVLLDPQFNFIRVNKVYADACGFAADFFIGKNHFSLYPSEELEEKFRSVVETGIPYTVYARPFEWPDKPELGTTYWDLAAYPVKGASGKVEGVLLTLLEVTERMLAEKKLRSSNQLLDSIINNIPNMIFLKRASDLRFELFNSAGEELVGRSQQEMIGRNDYDFFPKEQADFFTSKDREVLEQEGVVDIPEEAMKTPHGTRILHTRKLALRDEQGRPQFLLGISEDITERQHYIDGLRKAQELAEEIAEAKSNFLANMSHEIRTPMNAIIGLSQLALNKQTTPEVRGYLEKIFNSSSSLMDILNDILDLSKLDARRMAIEHVRFDMDTVLDNLNDLFAARAEDKYLDFNIEVGPGIPRDLVGDALRLQQVLANLLGNAIKFTEQGGVTLRVGLKQAGEGQATLLFSVEDTGIGIAKEDIHKLFQPFSQVDDSITRRFGGTGLGLSISHNLLKLMGSDFSVTSTPGRGTTFSFELVLGIAPHAAHGKVAQRKGQREAGALASELRDHGQPLSGARILVAEDDAINQQVVREFLELSGVAVAIAGNGGEALELLERGRFDAVLMDVHMPVMNGLEATRRIRATPRFADLPVIALTADIASEEREGYLASGMNDFIAKPLHPNELVGTLLRWVKPGEKNAMASGAGSPAAAGSPDLDSLPGFELGNILKMLNGNRHKLTELLLAFMSNMAGASAEIADKADAGDFQAARELAHKLKGTAGNLGAVALHAAAGQLEREFKAGRCDPATLDAFREEFDRAMSALAGLRQHRFPTERLPSPQPSPGGRGGEREGQASIPEALGSAALKLDGLLEENDFVADERLDELKKHLPPGKHGQFDTLRKHIRNIQYTKARQALRALVEFPRHPGALNGQNQATSNGADRR